MAERECHTCPDYAWLVSEAAVALETAEHSFDRDRNTSTERTLNLRRAAFINARTQYIEHKAAHSPHVQATP